MSDSFGSTVDAPRADRAERLAGWRPYGWIAAALVLAHGILLVDGLRRNYVVVDEVGQVPAGLWNWETADFSLYSVNPPLARMTAALPVMLASPNTKALQAASEPGQRLELLVGREFARNNADRFFELIKLARLPIVLWSLVGAVLIYRWARDLYGGAGGCLALSLWCFDPLVLAFGQVVTPDVPAAVAGLAATYAFRSYLKRGTWGSALAAGVLLGVAELTKFTLLILYPVWALLWLAAGRRPRDDAARPRWTAPAQGLLILAASLYVINLGYAFNGSCRRLADYRFVSRTFAGPSGSWGEENWGNRLRGAWLGELPVPLPADFLNGIDVQRRDFEGRYASYLLGEWRGHGWWYYYLVGLAVKEPLGTLGLVAASIVLALIGHPAARKGEEAFLLVPAAAVLAIVSSQTGFNHHLRYLLPLYPFVAVSTGKLAYFWRPGRWRVGGVWAVLLLWSISASLRIHPHSMSYFNEAAGGPIRGQAYLIDSNIDWGQDLLYLKDWLAHHPEAQPLSLAYYNVIGPAMEGIQADLPPPGPGGHFGTGADDPEILGPKPGYYAVSVNYLRGSTMFPASAGGSTPMPDDYQYFRAFQPIARAGYSIYIYHIQPEEADAERALLGLPPLAAREAEPPGGGGEPPELGGQSR